MYTTSYEVHRRQFVHLIDEIQGVVSESSDVALQQSINPLLEMLKAGINFAMTTKPTIISPLESTVPESEDSVDERSEPDSVAKQPGALPKPPSNGILNIPNAKHRLELSEEDWEAARRDVQHAIRKKKLDRESATPEAQKGKMIAALKYMQKLKTENGELKWPGFQGENKMAVIMNFIKWEIHLMQENL